MKNKEKFSKEIIDIACKGGTIAVTKDNKVVNCNNNTCEQCLFNIDNDECYCVITILNDGLNQNM